MRTKREEPQSGTRMGTKWEQSGTRMGTKCQQEQESGTRMGTKLAQRGKVVVTSNPHSRDEAGSVGEFAGLLVLREVLGWWSARFHLIS